MGEIKLLNNSSIPDFCYGSAIVKTYRYGKFSSKAAVKYWIKNALTDRKQFHTDRSLPKAVRCAMDHGCHMFDTSSAYGGSEYSIGKTLKAYSRKSYYLVTKLCNSDQYQHNVRAALMKSLKELGTDYVDVYLMHWPVTGEYTKSWAEMESLYKEGLCKAIGVCNCNIHHLEEIERTGSILPMINQFECHPLLTQQKLRDYCQSRNIQVMAYTPTARMDERLKKTVLVKLSQKYSRSIAQIILRWHKQIGNIPVVNTSNLDHLIENISVDDFVLTDKEIEEIERININSRLRYDPDNCDFRLL